MGTAAVAGGLVALVALSLTSFPLEMPGTLALTGLAFGLIAGDPRRPVAVSAEARSTPEGETAVARPRALACAGVAGSLALVPCVAVRAERSVRSSRWLGTAERALHRDLGLVGAEEALPALQEAVAAAPNDYRAHLRTAQMFLREHRSS